MIKRIGHLVPGWARGVIATMLEAVTPGNGTVRTRWLRNPEVQPGAEVCIFVSYAPESVMPEYSLFHARAWAKAGFKVIVVLNTNRFDEPVQADDLEFASGVLVRENRGYDFGAWASALEQTANIGSASLVAIVNDSVLGPLDTFEALLQRVRASDADVVGGTESREFGRHFQSYLLFFRSRALNTEAFWRFWRNVRAGGRIVAIYRYEQRLTKLLERAGLTCTALFPSRDPRNPTLTRWRELIEEGFPYLKVQLLRDNPFNTDLNGWQHVLRERGYDPELAPPHVRMAAQNAPAIRARTRDTTRSRKRESRR